MFLKMGAESLVAGVQMTVQGSLQLGAELSSKAAKMRIQLYQYMTSGWVAYDDVTLAKSDIETKYYYAGGQRVAMRIGNGSGGTGAKILLGDHLGSTSVTVNADGNEAGWIRYKPWGEQRSSWGTTPTKYRYTGQREESFGLYYYGARWYDPYLGRFAQADTDVPESQGVQGWDRYCFVSNNPLRFVDPTGHYGVEVHYYVTYNLTYTAVSRIGAQNNWSADKIKQVASKMAETISQANMSVDNQWVVHEPNGDSVAGGSSLDEQIDQTNREFPHKMDLDDALGLVDDASDPSSFGRGLHSVQDYYSHRMKSGLDNAALIATTHRFYNWDEYNHPLDKPPLFLCNPYSFGSEDWANLADLLMYFMTDNLISDYLDNFDQQYWEDYYQDILKAIEDNQKISDAEEKQY